MTAALDGGWRAMDGGRRRRLAEADGHRRLASGGGYTEAGLLAYRFLIQKKTFIKP